MRCAEKGRATINLPDSRNLQPKNTSPVLPWESFISRYAGREEDKQPMGNERRVWLLNCDIFVRAVIFFNSYLFSILHSLSFSSLYNFRFINFSFHRFRPRLSNQRRIKRFIFENRSSYISVPNMNLYSFFKERKKETDNTFGSLCSFERDFAGNCWTSSK